MKKWDKVEIKTIDDAFQHLAKSIVIQAIKDYREILRTNRIKKLSRAKYNQKELENFFLSEWYYALSDFDGQRLINILKEQEDYHDTTD